MDAGGFERHSGFDFLRNVPHHYVGRASKVTPSGRLQSAVVVLLSDAMLVCSNRGGIHRHFYIRDIEAVTLYPRGRIYFSIDSRTNSAFQGGNSAAASRPTAPKAEETTTHNMLLTTLGNTKLVTILAQLYAGLTGRSLPQSEEEAPPTLSELRLRPASSSPGKVPSELTELLRLAKAKNSLETIEAAEAAAQPAKPAAAASWMPRPGGRDEKHDDPTSIRLSALQAETLTRRQRPFSLPHDDERGAAAGAFLSATGTLPAPSGHDLGIAMVRFANRGLTATFAAHRSLWRYLHAVAEQLPGAQQAPLVQLSFVAPPSTATAPDKATVSLCEPLFRVVMQQYTPLVPHTVSVETGRGGYALGPGDALAFWNGTSKA